MWYAGGSLERHCPVESECKPCKSSYIFLEVYYKKKKKTNSTIFISDSLTMLHSIDGAGIQDSLASVSQVLGL